MTTAGQARRRISVTLFDPVAQHLDTLGDRLGTNRPETIRRALTCLDVQTSLTPTQDLLIRDRATGETTLVRFV